MLTAGQRYTWSSHSIPKHLPKGIVDTRASNDVYKYVPRFMEIERRIVLTRGWEQVIMECYYLISTMFQFRMKKKSKDGWGVGSII